MTRHVYGEIPDDYYTKAYLPLNPRLFEIFEALGWDHVISKFDDVADYVKRFETIFRKAEIRSVTVLDMEVPCCSALPRIVMKAMEDAGKTIPVRECVISSRGEIVEKDTEGKHLSVKAG